jgi:phosphoglycolate phosphatase
MSKARRAVVFDLDGTLIDSRRAVPACLSLALADLGHEIDGFDPRRVIGPPLRAALPALLQELGVTADIDDVLLRFRDHYTRSAAALTAVYDGVPEALDNIGQDFMLAIATSKPDLLTVPLLEQLGLSQRFLVVAAPSATATEDKRATLSRCARLLGDRQVQPVMVVGDHRLDIEAAIAEGLPSIGVTWGMSTRSQLDEAGPASIVDHPAELAKVVSSLTESVR